MAETREGAEIHVGLSVFDLTLRGRQFSETVPLFIKLSAGLRPRHGKWGSLGSGSGGPGQFPILISSWGQQK